MHLVVGLGNPGSQYNNTRHNVGWAVLDSLAVRFGWIRRADEFNDQARSKFEGLTIDGNVSGKKVMLLKPATFMNLSGRSVQQAMAFYQLAPTEILVVLDDLALPCGKIRLRASGSSGGHNGLKDIERALASDAYPRLRLGIDPPPSRVPGRDYVLGTFSSAQRNLIDPAMDRAGDAIVTWIERGLDSAMNQYNQSAAGDTPAGE
jgi:PTH1 family peptidyl-tRNA hydrolase